MDPRGPQSMKEGGLARIGHQPEAITDEQLRAPLKSEPQRDRLGRRRTGRSASIEAEQQLLGALLTNNGSMTTSRALSARAFLRSRSSPHL